MRLVTTTSNKFHQITNIVQYKIRLTSSSCKPRYSKDLVNKTWHITRGSMKLHGMNTFLK